MAAGTVGLLPPQDLSVRWAPGGRGAHACLSGRAHLHLRSRQCFLEHGCCQPWCGYETANSKVPPLISKGQIWVSVLAAPAFFERLGDLRIKLLG